MVLERRMRKQFCEALVSTAVILIQLELSFGLACDTVVPLVLVQFCFTDTFMGVNVPLPTPQKA